MRKLNEIANALEASNFYVIEHNDCYVKVTDNDLWPDLNIYFTENEDGVEWNVHVPADWNGVINRYCMEDMNEFVENVLGIVEEEI